MTRDRLARSSTFDLFGIVKRIVYAKAAVPVPSRTVGRHPHQHRDLMLAVLGGLGDVERDLAHAAPKAGATPRSGWRGTEPLSAAGSGWHRVDWSYWGYWHWHCVPIAHVYHHNQGTRLEHS